MFNLSISVLGSPRIEQDGAPIAVDTRKAIALITFLAVTNRHYDRDQLARLLWDGELSRGRAALRRTLSVLKKALVGEWLHIEKEGIKLQDRPGLWLDAAVYLERLAAHEAHRHQEGEVCPRCLPFLLEAVSLYRDSFLAGFLLADAVNFAHWQLTEAAFFQRKQAGVLQTLMIHHAQIEEYETAVSFGRRWLQLEPTHEPAHQWLMKLYAWQGKISQVQPQYEDCARLLAQTLGLAPQAETTELFNRIRRGDLLPKPTSTLRDRGQLPSPHTIRNHFQLPANLPRPLTPLIGRDVELREIEARLKQPHCRLLTITGIGGAGKTRLAVEFAWQQRAFFAHGVYYLPLAAINSADYLITALADTLQITLSGPNAKKQLLNYLSGKELLLILDNFEHLLDEAGLLLEILQDAPGVKLLVTSRICLNYQVEWLYEVGGLAYVPDNRRNPGSQGAVELFLYHANRLNPHFQANAAQPTAAAESTAVAEKTALLQICRLLDGMPLGIELAAALLPQFSCTQIAAAISHNLDFLKTSLRDMPPQHRSLRAVFEHSWQLLSPKEQILLQQLAVFGGSFSQAAAMAIISAATPDLLANLVNKSLLQEKANGRYEMHDLIQQYAREKLERQPHQAEHVRQRHGYYFLDFLHRYTRDLKTAAQEHALAALRREMDNVHLAWHWAVREQEEPILAQVVDGLSLLYDFNNWFFEGRKVFTQAADALAMTMPQSNLITSLLARQAFFLHRLSLYPEAKSLLLDCLSDFRQKNQVEEILFCLLQLGTVAFFLGEYEAARVYLDESLQLGQTLEDPWHMAYSYNSLGNVYRVLGDYQRTFQCFEQALQLRRECGDKRGIAVTLNNLGSTAEVVGDYKQARHLLQESLILKKELGDRKGMGMSMLNLGYVLSQLGEHLQARKLLSKSFTIFQEVGESAGAALAMTNQGNIAYTLGQLAEARDFYCESLKISQAITDRRGIVFSLNDLGKVARAQHNLPDAQAYFCRALALAVEMKAVSQMLEALAGIADLLYQAGDSKSALLLLTILLEQAALDRETREYAHTLWDEVQRQLSVTVIQLVQERASGENLFSLAEETLVQLGTPRL